MAKSSAIIRAPESLAARRTAIDRAYSPMAVIRNTFLSGKPPMGQEYLIGSLIGLSEVHLHSFPELWELLQRAETLEWNKELVIPAETKERVAVKNFGSFAQLYQELVEPWVGKYDDLKATYARYARQEISREQGVEELGKLRKQGRPTKEEEQDKPDIIRFKYGTQAAYLTARLARDHPNLFADLQVGKYPSVRAAAKAAGLVRDLTRFERLVREWKKASTEERARFLEWISQENASPDSRATP